MALAQISTPISFSLHNHGAIIQTRKNNPSCLVRVSCIGGGSCTFATGSPLLPVKSKISRGRRCGNRSASLSIRCEQSTDGNNGLDTWLGRGAMVGFAVAITVEISTGKGLLENFGVISPLPTAALVLTGLVGVLTAVFIFQSASKN